MTLRFSCRRFARCEDEGSLLADRSEENMRHGRDSLIKSPVNIDDFNLGQKTTQLISQHIIPPKGPSSLR